MPNMDYPGPCASCIADNCGIVDQTYTEEWIERKRKNNEEKEKK